MRPILSLLFILSILFLFPNASQAALKKAPNAILKKECKSEIYKNGHQSIKEKWRIGKDRIKRRIQQFKRTAQLTFPSGKLLTTLIFLVLSIVLFAVGGLTTLAAIFNILGSVSVILALVFFIFWVMKKSNQAKVPVN